MDAIRENDLKLGRDFACGPKPMLAPSRPMHWRRESLLFGKEAARHVVSVPALAVYSPAETGCPFSRHNKRSAKTVRCSEVRRWSYEQNERKSCRSDSENPVMTASEHLSGAGI